MSVEIKEIGTILIISLSGKIDGKTSPGVQEQIMAVVKKGTGMVLDLANVSFMASAGLRVLLSVTKQLPSGRLVLTGLSEQLQDVMEVTGFLDYFQIRDRVEQGLAVLETQ